MVERAARVSLFHVTLVCFWGTIIINIIMHLLLNDDDVVVVVKQKY